MALSKIPDLTHSYKGQEYTFVGQLEDYLKEIECPICHSIVSEPVLASCGHLFCKECHNKLERPMGLHGSINGRYQCPVCTQQHTIVEDKFIDSRVKNLKVRCLNHTKGCDWVGCMSDEGQHRAKQGGCDYEDMQCAHGCGNTIRRMTQQAHSVECPMRPHNCEYCGDEGPYQCIIGDHLDTCRRYPVQCPYGCQEKIPREDVIREVKLKEELSATAKKLEVEECRANQLEQDMKAKMKHIDELKRNNSATTGRIAQLKSDAAATARQIRKLERDSIAQTEHIHQLERDTEAKTQGIRDLERNINEKTERIRVLTQDTEAKARQIRNLESETETERRQYLEKIDQLTEAKKSLMKGNSQMQNKLFILLIIVIICFMLLMYVSFKPLLTEQVESV